MFKLSNLTIVILLGFIPVTYNACSEIEPIFSGDRSQKLEGNDGGTIVGNPLQERAVGFARYQTTNSGAETFAQLCISQVVFEKSDTLEDHVFNVGLVNLDPDGTMIGDFQLGDGSYDQVRLIVDSSCETAASVVLSNPSGQYQSREDMELRFRGPFQVSDHTHLDLNIQRLMEELSSVSNFERIDEIFESFIGDVELEGNDDDDDDDDD